MGKGRAIKIRRREFLKSEKNPDEKKSLKMGKLNQIFSNGQI